MTEPSFVQFLSRVLALLVDELPRVARVVTQKLDGYSAALRVGDEALVVAARGSKLRLVFESTVADVDLSISPATMRALVDGELSFTQAVLQERVQLRGSLDALLAFDDAFMTFAQGAMRLPGVLDLREAYMNACSARSATKGGSHGEATPGQ